MIRQHSQHSMDEAREQAALYALGALRGSEAQEFERHLDSGCAVCAAELAAFSAVAGELGRATRPEAPAVAVRARALARVAGESVATAPVLERDGVRFVRGDQVAWEPGTVPAVEVKTLSLDTERSYRTKLVRMAPGAKLRPHRHADIEESYVLEGDLWVSGVLMRAGDYCRAESGSVHSGVRTDGGCVFIAVCSERDEWLGEH